MLWSSVGTLGSLLTLLLISHPALIRLSAVYLAAMTALHVKKKYKLKSVNGTSIV